MNQLASPIVAVSDLGAEALRIRAVNTAIVDLPIRRAHQFAKAKISTQAFLIVEIETEGGITGLGEGATPGGPWWSGDSIETMKVMVDTYLAPAIIGQSAGDITALHNLMNKAVFANQFAKAAIDTALWDIVGKALDAPVYALFGGMVRDSTEISWALATGVAASDIAEAEDMVERGAARVFKLKGGAKPPREDAERAVAVAQALAGRAEIRIDLNQVWDETTANQWIPVMIEGGVTVVEQPVQGWNFDALRRIRERFGIKVMADESVFTLQDAMRLASSAAVDVFAFKVMKAGGLHACRQIAGIAEAAGIASYGGTFLESSIGTSAGLQVAAAERSVTFGSEFIGGIWLADEIVTEPLVYQDFHVFVPTRPGIGMTLDRDKFNHYRRK
ncbi:muconate/chloromuconate family cycloisomerase [Sphingomonas fennica]|uniref:Mandelate racemase/muconate lactonizing enzyme C-terminal domain-containing protein n=1 Tax=Edaphosphingomonas fennica TaxID=114404 RepID=A0A2T4HLZ4_9SPHN|nr:muconate/chloromuconate family cycloisomerase [Sphingomonas fennica]PTD16809.1 hypothetical protein CV103_20050 [Sphingomonas fennica]